MSAHHLALLAGLFLVPLAALALGHRLVRRPRRHRLTFWGVVMGHTLAIALVSVAALARPERWDAADRLRGLLGFWGLLLGGLLGGAIGWALGGGGDADDRAMD